MKSQKTSATKQIIQTTLPASLSFQPSSRDGESVVVMEPDYDPCNYPEGWRAVFCWGCGGYLLESEVEAGGVSFVFESGILVGAEHRKCEGRSPFPDFDGREYPCCD